MNQSSPAALEPTEYNIEVMCTWKIRGKFTENDEEKVDTWMYRTKRYKESWELGEKK